MINIDWQLVPPQNIKSDSLNEDQSEMTYFPRITHSRHISTKQLLKQASVRTPFDRATLGAALGHIVDALVEQLRQGNTVSLDELGTFGLQIATDKPLRSQEIREPGHVEVRGVRYTPSPDLLSLVGHPQFVWTPTMPLSAGSHHPTDEQILETLSAWFTSHDSVKCKDISALFNLKPTAANALMNHLLHSGVLVKSGKGKNTVYLLNDRNKVS